ncbi:diaminopimelate epimerase [Neobacillus sp. MER 74]|uniref:diaminopimelate epimerase n=1 Tax=Neobacillus sp. MER 74 TaxID=2939566 RepID=UPI0020408688|nr:diaminopimelate epimerase [Neobacillus sp. MER 74]MCM3114476.1 diaminopimelate epimerase [Neobacillus sp. MER 74]
MEVQLIKGHGSGNDFLIIDEMSNQYVFSESERADLARMLCNRQSELGADGILFVMNSKHADARMRVFNSDGSEASMCGNGLRLVARYVCEHLGQNKAVIETMKANLKVSKQNELLPDIHTYQVEISPVLFELKALPLNLNKPTLFNEKIEELSADLRFTALAVPNPHLIAIVEAEHLEGDLQKHLSEKVNGPNHLFPDGVNVSFVKHLQPGAIYVRTFERGVGFTNACGTAMSASTLVTCLLELNKLENVVNVYNNGGKVQCVAHESEGKYTIDLIGNATYLYNATVNVDLENHSFTISSKTELSEQATYEQLQNEAKKFVETNLKG